MDAQGTPEEAFHIKDEAIAWPSWFNQVGIHWSLSYLWTVVEH